MTMRFKMDIFQVVIMVETQILIQFGSLFLAIQPEENMLVLTAYWEHITLLQM